MSTFIYQFNIYSILCCLKLTFWITEAIFQVVFVVVRLFVILCNEKISQEARNKCMIQNNHYQPINTFSLNRLHLKYAIFMFQSNELFNVHQCNSRQLKLKPPITTPGTIYLTVEWIRSSFDICFMNLALQLPYDVDCVEFFLFTAFSICLRSVFLYLLSGERNRLLLAISACKKHHSFRWIWVEMKEKGKRRAREIKRDRWRREMKRGERREWNRRRTR